MHSKGYYRKLVLFKKFSENFALIKEHTQIYREGKLPPTIKIVCPLCLKGFGENSLNQIYSDSLTEEHVIPKSLKKGRAGILTCKLCNNKSGSSIDNMLAVERNVNSFLHGKIGGEIKTELHFKSKDHPLPATVKQLPNNSLLFKIMDKSSLKDLPLKNNGFEFIFDSPIVKSQIAQLKIAFLTAFEKFGYGFILNSTYEPIRRQILNPKTEILQSFGNLDPPPDTLEGVYFNIPKEGLKCIIVVFKLKVNGNDDLRSVLLPPPNSDCIKFYEQFSNYKKIGKVAIRALPLPSENYLTHPTFKLFSVLWESYEKAIEKHFKNKE